MKTEVINSIHFEDGKDGNFISAFKQIFPKTGYTFCLWDFKAVGGKRGSYDLELETLVQKQGSAETHHFIYKKHVTDMTIIDVLNRDVTGAVERRTIISMIGNDTFIEELDEFLNNLGNGE